MTLLEKTKPMLIWVKYQKVGNRKDLWRIWWIFAVLGNKKQSQTNPIYLAPRFIWGLIVQVEKTKPICAVLI